MESAWTAKPLAALLAILPVFVAGAAASPAPADSPLKEIGRVRVTTPFCKAALDHALSGISVVLGNDVRLALDQAALRKLDGERNPLIVYRGQQQLLDDYVATREAAVAGRHAISLLKLEAKDAPSEAQKTSLISLANALDSALVQQKVLAETVAGSVMRADSYRPFADNAQPRMAFTVMQPENIERLNLPVPRAFADSSGNLFPNAKRDADDIERHLPRLTSDESDAATRIDGAFDPC